MRIALFHSLPARLAGGLFLAIVVLFCACLGNNFINYDDPTYLLHNSHIQHGVTGEMIRWAFTTGYAANWHPLTWISHALDWQLFGAKPWGHHLVNILLHAGSTALLFLVLRRMTGSVWRSLFVAALFGCHPLRVESVAWIAERKDVLSTFFWMLTLWLYAAYAETRRAPKTPPWLSPLYWLTFATFALGLLSKPMLVTLPFVLLLLDYWPLGRLWEGGTYKAVFLEKIPLFLLATASSCVTFLVQQYGGGLNRNIPAFDLGAKFANAALSYVRYIGKFFFPTDLGVFYPLSSAIPVWQIVASIVLLLAITILALWQLRRRPYLAVGWFWYLGTALPIIGLIQIGGQAMADRYTYIPLIGCAIALAWGVTDIWRQRDLPRNLLLMAGAFALLLCAIQTIMQIGRWQDSESLFQHTLAVTKQNPVAHNNLGCALLEKGSYDKAIPHFEQVLALVDGNPDAQQLGLPSLVPRAHFNLAAIFMLKQHYAEAIPHYRAGLALLPGTANAHFELGRALMETKQWADAAAEMKMTLHLAPDSAPVHNYLGLVLRQMGRLEEAMAQYHAALAINPRDADARINLGAALGRAGRFEEAAREFQQVVTDTPNNAVARNNLGLSLENLGRFDEAITQYREALRLAPTYTAAQQNLDTTLQRKAEKK